MATSLYRTASWESQWYLLKRISTLYCWTYHSSTVSAVCIAIYKNGQIEVRGLHIVAGYPPRSHPSASHPSSHHILIKSTLPHHTISIITSFLITLSHTTFSATPSLAFSLTSHPPSIPHHPPSPSHTPVLHTTPTSSL